MDLAYGRSRAIVKFTMLEFIARVPYQAWERIGYLALARHRRRSALATRVFGRIVQTRAEQDNEQWHLLILHDLIQRRGLIQPLPGSPPSRRHFRALTAAEVSTWHVHFRVTLCMPRLRYLRLTDLPGVDYISARGTSYRKGGLT